MINFGNLSPVGADLGLFLYFNNDQYKKPMVSRVKGSDGNAIWKGDGIAAGLDLIHTGVNDSNTLYLTMAEDRPGASIVMAKWAGGQYYSPLQVWTSVQLTSGQWFFESLNKNLLQVSGLTEGSALVVGAYPEQHTPDFLPKTPGQLWVSTP